MPLVKQGQMTRDPLHRSAKVGDPLWNSFRWQRDTKLLSIEASQLYTHRRQKAGGQEGRRAEVVVVVVVVVVTVEGEIITMRSAS